MILKSLGFRILLVNFTLLVAPLLVYFFFVFDWEYHDQIVTDIQRFRNLGFSRAALLSETIRDEYSALDIYTDLLRLRDPAKTLPKEAMETKLKEIVTEGDYLRLAYLDNNLILKASNEVDTEGKDYTFSYYLRKSLSEGQSAYLAIDVDTHKESLFIAKSVRARENWALEGVLYLSLNTQKLLANLTSTEYISDDERISLLTPDKVVFASSDPDFKYHLLYPLSAQRRKEIAIDHQFDVLELPKDSLDVSPYSNVDNVYQWTSDKITRMAIIMPVPLTEFYIMIDVSKRRIISRLEQEAKHTMLILLSISSLGCLISFAMGQWFSQPLKQLHRAVKSDLKLRYAPSAVGFEINDAGVAFNEMSERLVELSDRARLEKVKTETVAKELKIGHDIQQSILPHSIPTMEGVDVAGMSLPAQEVGGDFYDIFTLNDPSKLIITIADTSGKGVMACLYSVCLRSLLRSFGTQIEDLSRVLEETGLLFRQDIQYSSLLVSALIARWDQKARVLTYASAGPSFGFVLYRDGNDEPLKGSNAMIGSPRSEHCDSVKAELHPGDVVVLYTKGLIERQNGRGEFFGQERLKRLVREHLSAPAKEICDILSRACTEFSTTQQDADMTMVVLKIVGPHG